MITLPVARVRLVGKLKGRVTKPVHITMTDANIVRADHYQRTKNRTEGQLTVYLDMKYNEADSIITSNMKGSDMPRFFIRIDERFQERESAVQTWMKNNNIPGRLYGNKVNRSAMLGYVLGQWADAIAEGDQLTYADLETMMTEYYRFAHQGNQGRRKSVTVILEDNDIENAQKIWDYLLSEKERLNYEVGIPASKGDFNLILILYLALRRKALLIGSK